MTDELVSIYMTSDSEDVAFHIATSLVKERLVACANINNGTRSIYEWQGVLQLTNEITVFMKTTRAKANEAVRRAKELHSYETPCIVVLPIVDVDENYRQWVIGQLALAQVKHNPLGDF